MVDGTLPGTSGDLAYRLYRPPTPGPHPIIVYFHSGGWVLGDAISDDPLCRDVCVRSDAILISSDYRHAPEHRFHAAVDDAVAAVRWVADNAEALGHTHQSVTMVDVAISGAPVRARIAKALRQFFAATRTPEPAS
jgi:acetyl esterase/lipase